MDRSKVIEKLRDFFATHFQSHRLEANDQIFELGFVNSLFAMQLVEFVEAEFGFDVESEDLDLENFETLAAIADLVARRAVARAA